MRGINDTRLTIRTLSKAYNDQWHEHLTHISESSGFFECFEFLNVSFTPNTWDLSERVHLPKSTERLKIIQNLNLYDFHHSEKSSLFVYSSHTMSIVLIKIAQTGESHPR